GEFENVIDQRLGARARQKLDDLLPRGSRFGVGVGADGDAANANSAEEQRRRIEIGYGSSQSSDDAYFAPHAKCFDDAGEERAADVVDGQVHALVFEEFLKSFAPIGIFGIEDDRGAKLAKAFGFLFAAREADDRMTERGSELRRGDT